MNRILACIDASAYANSVCDLAAWAATRLGAGVDLLHVIQRRDLAAAQQDLSGAIGLGAKSALLADLTRLDEAEARVAVERGRLLLAAGAQRLRDAGVSAVDPVARHGGIVETIVEREAAADLVVIGKRGASGEFASDHIGSKIERVARAGDKPVLIASRRIVPPAAVIVAFDGSPAATKALAFAADSPLFAGLPVHLVMAGPDDAAHRDRLAAAAARCAGRTEPVHTALVAGHADSVIADYVAERPDAMLVMGAYGHSPLRRLILGSTTTTMIRTVRLPVLLVR